MSPKMFKFPIEPFMKKLSSVVKYFVTSKISVFSITFSSAVKVLLS